MNFIAKYKSIFILLFFVCVGVFVFSLQHSNIEFSSGHHGWVSSHTLAIVKRANIDNGFLGYTCLTVNEEGSLHWEYFDRYPVLFSALMNFILVNKSSVVSEVYAARFVMNVIFVLTIIMSYKLLSVVTKSTLTSLIAVLFTFSGVYFIYYKDMVHYDQPALLSIVIMAYLVALVEKGKKVKFLYVWAFLLPLLGRGYSVVFLLVIWCLVSICLNYKSNKIIYFFKQKSFKCFVISVISCSLFLMYNIHREAGIRNVSYEDTSIVKSAKHRLGLETLIEKRNSNNKEVDYKDFSIVQAKRFVKGLLPYVLFPFSNNDSEIGTQEILFSSFWLLFILCGSIYTVLSKKEVSIYLMENKLVFIVTILSGGFWLFVMKNLSAYHDYTTFYYILIYLIIFSITIKRFGRKIKIGVLFLGVLLFVGSLLKVHEIRNIENSTSEIKHQEIDRVKEDLVKGEVVSFATNHHEFVKGCYFEMCYYFNEYVITDEGSKGSTKIISKDKNLEYPLLTPKNKSIFLYQK